MGYLNPASNNPAQGTKLSTEDKRNSHQNGHVMRSKTQSFQKFNIEAESMFISSILIVISLIYNSQLPI